MCNISHIEKLKTGVLVWLLFLALVGCVSPSDAPAATSKAAAAETVVIYAPATPASVPILLAARHVDGAQVTIFANHTQANVEFLRGDVDILVTGLSVGVGLFANGAPVQVVNSYVAGMTYLVTYGQKVERFADLKGQSIYLPFEGSPIEETTRFFVEREGLTWNKDIKPLYAPFATSVELLKLGKAAAVVLPEPSVSLVEALPGIHVSLSYRQLWDAETGSDAGYPQVTPFVKREWAAAHPELIARFNREVAAAIESVHEDPERAAAETSAALGLPEGVLLKALSRTDFAFVTGEALANDVRSYHASLGKPLADTYDTFFYRAP